MEIKVDVSVCQQELATMKQIQQQIEDIHTFDEAVFFNQSRGETMEAMKEVLQELVSLKKNISSRMTTIERKLTSYIEEYMLLEKQVEETIVK